MTQSLICFFRFFCNLLRYMCALSHDHQLLSFGCKRTNSHLIVFIDNKNVLSHNVKLLISMNKHSFFPVVPFSFPGLSLPSSCLSSFLLGLFPFLFLPGIPFDILLRLVPAFFPFSSSHVFPFIQGQYWFGFTFPHFFTKLTWRQCCT